MLRNALILGIVELALGIFVIGQGTGSPQRPDKKLVRGNISQN
jgi:hypothetical protein